MRMNNRLLERGIDRVARRVALMSLGVLIVATLLFSSQTGLSWSGARASAEAASLSWLHTEGNRIVDESGRTVVLRGLNIENREWVWNSGPRIDFERRAILKVTSAPPDGWGANAILLAISSGPVNRNDATYLGQLDELIALAKSNGAYTLLVFRTAEPDGAQPDMPDHAAEDAMAALAGRYAAEPAVLYGLQVEPHNVSWSTLKPRFVSMIDAIRAKNPRALVVVPGTQWGRYVHWALTDPISRDNIVYKSHYYDPFSAFDAEYQLSLVTATYPVILGEFGTGSQMSQADVESLLDRVEALGISWVGWVFHKVGCPCVLTDTTTWTTTPYGDEIKARLQATASTVLPVADIDAVQVPDTTLPVADVEVAQVTETTLPVADVEVAQVIESTQPVTDLVSVDVTDTIQPVADIEAVQATDVTQPITDTDNGGGQVTDTALVTADAVAVSSPTPASIPAIVLVQPGAIWWYFKGTTEPPSDWASAGFDDSAWPSGPSGFGYGDGDDATILDDMEGHYVSLYIRKAFTIDDPTKITKLVLAMDYDDAFVAYLNGVMVARANVTGLPPLYNYRAGLSHEASGGDSSPGPVEEFDISGFIHLLVPGTNVIAIQGHNKGLDSSDFSLIPSLISD